MTEKLQLMSMLKTTKEHGISLSVLFHEQAQQMMRLANG
jgi:hypothetical protein